MPTYTILCPECGTQADKRLSFAEYDNVKAGTHVIPCGTCGSNSEISFNPGKVSFVLKDGESGGWATKTIKEKTYRSNRRDEMARRERDHVFKPKLQPNYAGVETGTWREAQEMARKEGGNDSASSYDSLVSKEKA